MNSGAGRSSPPHRRPRCSAPGAKPQKVEQRHGGGNDQEEEQTPVAPGVGDATFVSSPALISATNDRLPARNRAPPPRQR
ncbi:MAG: hypothetical protein U0841_31860 [Chloroflexia bacterium]